MVKLHVEVDKLTCACHAKVDPNYNICSPKGMDHCQRRFIPFGFSRLLEGGNRVLVNLGEVKQSALKMTKVVSRLPIHQSNDSIKR